MNLINPSDTRTMVKFHNIITKLFPCGSNSSNVLSYNDPFERNVYIECPENETYPLSISRIIYTSDSSVGTLSGTIQDASLVRYNNPYKDGFHVNDLFFQNEESNSFSEQMSPPSVGDGIVVWMEHDKNSASMYESNSESSSESMINRKILFKGYIVSVSRAIGQSGIIYSIEANDMKCRLRDQTIRKVYNSSYKRNSMPNVKESVSVLDNPYVNEKLTVDDILKDIIDYANLSSFDIGDAVYFNYDSFDYNGLKFLQGFIPPMLSFDNVTILEAIYRLINSAGPYRMNYDPQTDKINFFKLDSLCNNCGREIKLRYGDGDFNKEFYDVNVISDTTGRRTSDVCNIIKAYSSDIEWYSGHFYVRRGESSYTTFNIQDGDKTSPCLQVPSKNWDGYNYYFGEFAMPYGESGTSLSEPYEIVGCPLYPVWDPVAGYEPFSQRFNKRIVVDEETNEDTIESNSYTINYGITINDRKYVTHANFLDTVGKNTYYNATGLSYEAYFPYGVCECCGGSGAVEEYSGTFQYFGKTRDIKGAKQNYPSCTPFDYNYVPSTNKVINTYIGNNATVPTRHPVPWKNICPVCRGTGMEPWFKMNTILSSLVDLTPDNTKIGELNSKRSSGESNSYSPQKDKTWQEISSDMSYRYPVCVQIEISTNNEAYKGEDVSNSGSLSKIEHSLIGAKQYEGADYLIFKVADDGSGDAIDEDERYVERLYYTQISSASGYSIDADRGMIIFKNNLGIPCKRPMKNPLIESSENGSGAKINAPCFIDDKLIYSSRGEMNGIGNKVTAFWRPARAWIICYFKRERFKSFLADRSSAFLDEKIGQSNNPASPVTVTKKIKDDDITRIKYEVVPRIEDNRYCAEIMKSRNQDDGNVEEFKVRPIIKGINLDNMRWQVSPWDIGKWNVPGVPSDDMDFEVPTNYEDMWNEVYSSNKKMNYIFPCGKFHSTEPLRDTEAKSLNLSGEELKTAMHSDMKGKIIAWVHKDERIKLLERATEELERRNNVQVTGSVDIRGEVPDFSKGMGFVTLYDGIKASVVRIEMNFSGAFSLSLEVGTEELRVGQEKESQQDYKRKIEGEIGKLNMSSAMGSNGSVDNGYSSDGIVKRLGAIEIGGN